MEHAVPSKNFQRENGTTFSEVPLFPEIFQWNKPKNHVPFTTQPEFPESLGKWKTPPGNSFSCSAKMASATDLQDTEDRPVPSSIARDRSLQSTSSFNEQQDCALVDYIQASVMAQYNKRLALATAYSAYSILKRKRFI